MSVTVTIVTRVSRATAVRVSGGRKATQARCPTDDV